ncbi:nuclease-related domain-containing protein [Aquipuribacter hungaricus]|uniref:nuclease-related domain-containing protein n=1 Tax=Aquipuribacter hungaricus TaxID=545624 RepID=UPI0030EC762D
MSTAGHGARQQQAAARRSVEEAERKLAAARAREHAWSAGAAGEEQVADTLAGLAQLGWVVLHDVAWPGRARANLDHVLIGPGGVLVVDTKNWSGTVTVDTDRGLRSNGYRKTKEIEAVQTARQALLTLVPALPPEVVAGLICLAAQDQEPVLLDGVVVVGRGQLLQHVLQRSAVLGAQAVMETAMTLGTALRRQPQDRIPAQAGPGRAPRNTAKPRAGSTRPRKRPARSARAGVLKLAAFGVVLGALVLFPDEVWRAYMSVVTAVVTPVADDLTQDLLGNVVPTTAPAP